MTRNYKNGRSSINALLDDYTFTIAAFIELYQASFDEKWLMEANKITGYALEHFFTELVTGNFFSIFTVVFCAFEIKLIELFR